MLQLLYGACFEFSSKLLRSCYVSLLTRFIAATEKDHHFATTDHVVDTVSLSYVDSEFAYPATNRAVVAKVAIFDTLNAGQDCGFGLQVAQSFEPLLKELGVDEFHTSIVSYRRHGVKLESVILPEIRVDCSGAVAAGRRVGAALFPYASVQGLPWFVSGWGTLTVDPMGREGYASPRGDVRGF